MTDPLHLGMEECIRKWTSRAWPLHGHHCFAINPCHVELLSSWSAWIKLSLAPSSRKKALSTSSMMVCKGSCSGCSSRRWLQSVACSSALTWTPPRTASRISPWEAIRRSNGCAGISFDARPLASDGVDCVSIPVGGHLAVLVKPSSPSTKVHGFSCLTHISKQSPCVLGFEAWSCFKDPSQGSSLICCKASGAHARMSSYWLFVPHGASNLLIGINLVPLLSQLWIGRLSKLIGHGASLSCLSMQACRRSVKSRSSPASLAHICVGSISLPAAWFVLGSIVLFMVAAFGIYRLTSFQRPL